MEFYSIYNNRPIRLSKKTRVFAYESLHHKYGLLTKKTMTVSLDDIKNFNSLSNYDKHDISIDRVCKEAPIRICKDEKISGSASLGKAIYHQIPASYEDKCLPSVSHLTIDYEEILKHGLERIENKIEKSLKENKEDRQQKFLKSCKNTCKSFRIWHKRYIDELNEKIEYKDNLENLKVVPLKKAQTFYQAVQSIWFVFAFTRLCGNWPGIGRIDVLLGDFLKNDLQKNIITIDEAREILAHFFIKGCEWICGDDIGSGDAQHYQNIVLSGVDENGNDITNEVTYLVLDIIEELGISDFPISIRINKNTPEKLLIRASEVIRHGGGIIAFYNEEKVIESLVEYGYELKEARKFANDGCWEVQVPGKTKFNYVPFDGLQILQRKTLNNYENINYTSFNDLFNQFINDLSNKIKEIFIDASNCFYYDKNNMIVRKEEGICSVVSLFEQGCIEKGYSYLENGPKYNVLSPHLGGLADICNSLYAIKKIVFDEKKISFSEYMNILKNNWECNEVLRQYVKNNYLYYGNDNDEVDKIAFDIVDRFGDICNSYKGKIQIDIPAGISTFGRQIQWAPMRFATADGHKKNEILSPNCAPCPNTDKESITAIIKSYCKLPLKKMVTGAALDIRLLPNDVKDKNIIISLLKGFIELGGYFIQPDVVDINVLKKAQENPDEYQTLSVRVSGWNARFITLDKEWQDMIINKNS